MAFCLLLCWGDSQLENLHLCSDSSRSLVRPANTVFSWMCNCFFLIEKHYNYCFYLILHFFSICYLVCLFTLFSNFLEWKDFFFPGHLYGSMSFHEKHAIVVFSKSMQAVFWASFGSCLEKYPMVIPYFVSFTSKFEHFHGQS